jgi:predicted acetylornithine/succinylornithine family transaminase
MKTGQPIIEKENRYVTHTYTRPAIVFERGQGVYLFDIEGNRYLDFTSGICVTSLGHGDPEWVERVRQQAGKLTHVSNLYHTAPHAELAEALVEASFADRVYFCNSGTEANEAAIKFARKWARTRFGEEKTDLVAFENGFHGRTIGSLALTDRDNYRKPFAPLMPGARFARFNDLDSAAQTITHQTCGVFVEPLQGEGGVHPAEKAFLTGLREICDRNNALLIYDEIQCGLGRTGQLWAHQTAGVAPDIMTLAKPLAGGLPIGVTLMKSAVADVLKPGDHGSTFAAGPLVCAAAQVVFKRINTPSFLSNVRDLGTYLSQRLSALNSPHIQAIRGAGLLWGVELDGPVDPLIQGARSEGLLLIKAGPNVLRLAPPLIVDRKQIDTAIDIIERNLSQISTGEKS